MYSVTRCRNENDSCIRNEVSLMFVTHSVSGIWSGDV